MKKIKKFSLKAMLLTIVAALTIGFTGCSDELSGDQTQGKPGYLSINLKTLKPKQTKSSSILTTDYTKITNLNVFIYRSGTLILKKYFTTQTNAANDPFTTNGDPNAIDIKVGELDVNTDSVVVLANYGIIPPATDISTTTALQNIEVPTVGDFPNGLCMTGVAKITDAGNFAYNSAVKIAPVVSKISVKWLTSGDAAYYDITGIYIVNAIDHTKLPIILRDGTNDIKFLLTPTTPNKTASSGYNVTNAKDYDIYHFTLNNTAGILSDVSAIGDSLRVANTYSYYVGENYHADLPTTRNNGHLYTAAETQNHNANTIILIEATPRTGAGIPTWIGTEKKYYTYDLNKSLASTPGNTTPNAAVSIPGITYDGFSTKRKTNYIVTFNLTSVGTTYPFERLSTLNVTVTADPWDYATTDNITF